MNMEILAPAGSRESLEAAVRCGTDAVYLGASAFNARRNADNFDSLSLSDAVRYCHGRNVQVYVTLNTLIFNSEEKAFLSCLEEVLDAGPDHLIIQDLGVLHLIRSVCPTIPICGSTQMAVHNVSGAHALEDLGIDQVVLARELSLEEIEKIRSETDMRLETFVHGAHCMSVSGLCYFSAAFGERSGNRGLCAQPCRLDFKCNARDYALSLKDMSLIKHVAELEKAGITALKIEGRMKRPEYVAAAVTAVKSALRGENPDTENLKKVFSRSGFTDGYLMGKRNASMFGVRSAEDISSAKEVLGKLAGLYRHEYPHVPVNMKLCMDAKDTVLTVSDGKITVSSKSSTEQADTGVLTPEIAERCLKKTGNTPYIVDNISVDIASSLRVPSSSISALRKHLLEDLLAKNSVGISYERTEFTPKTVYSRVPKAHTLRARFSKTDNIVFPEKFEMIILPLEELLKAPETLSKYPCICAELPTLIWPGTEAKIMESIKELQLHGLKHVTIPTLAHVYMLKDLGLILHGEHTLNITNSYSMERYADSGLSDSLLSTELTFKQSESMHTNIPKGVYVYGRLPLMFFRSCPARSTAGCGTCPGYSEVTDKTHASFKIVCHQKQYSVMHNSVPMYLGDIEMPSVDFLEFYFSGETTEEEEKILNFFEKKRKPDFLFTRGHAVKGVR